MSHASHYSPDEATREKIRKIYDVDANSIKRDIQILKDWIKQQPHLPQGATDDSFLERFLLRNKFSVERSKERIEKYYTLKGIHMDVFRNIELLSPSKHSDLIFLLPFLTDDLERIIIIKLSDNPLAINGDVMKFFKYAMAASEYYLRTDYVASIRIIQDFQGFTFSHFKKYAAKISVYSSLYQEAYFNRIGGIEYINVPPFLDVFMQGCRALMSPKTFKRISIHKSLDSLHKNVDKKYLPKEYGGEGKTLSEYLDIWDKEFQANIEDIEKTLVSEISDESLRVGEMKFNESFGINGTFKTLNLD